MPTPIRANARFSKATCQTGGGSHSETLPLKHNRHKSHSRTASVYQSSLEIGIDSDCALLLEWPSLIPLLTVIQKNFILSEIQYFWNFRGLHMRSTTVQIRQRGTLTLPAKLRAKYRLDEGDSLTILDLDGTILLSPKVPVVPKLAAEIERLRKAARLEVDDLLTSVSTRRTPSVSTRKRR